MMKPLSVPCAFFVALCLFDAIKYVQSGSPCKGTFLSTITYYGSCDCMCYTPCDDSAFTLCGEQCQIDADCVEEFKCLDDPSYQNKKRCQPKQCSDDTDCEGSATCDGTLCLIPTGSRSTTDCPCRDQTNTNSCPGNSNGKGKGNGKGRR